MTQELLFGQWVKQRRRALDLTQTMLARQVACASITLRKIESDRLRPSREIAERLAVALQLPSHVQGRFVLWARGQQGAGRDLVRAMNHSAPKSATPMGSLPALPTPLIGRGQDVAAVLGILVCDQVRLLTLVGAPGIGKTRLSLQVAAELRDHFAHGVYFVPLAGISDPALVPLAVAQVLAVQEIAGQTLVDSLKHFLRGKQALLLLDNFEHIMPAASVVAELVATVPGLTVLVTSRQALRLSIEHEYLVPPLALPNLDNRPFLEELPQYGAVELFLARARAIQPDFQLTDRNASTVAELCARLDGLPLAIELAAARVRLFTPLAMLRRLGSRLAWLTDGARDLPPRQQTLRAALDWSYLLLDEGERTLFRRLGVFMGGCTLEAAEAVCNAEQDLPVSLVTALGSLVEKNLLRREEGVGAAPRYDMLETLRAYAHEMLHKSEEAERMSRHHLLYFVNVVETAEQRFETAEESYWLDRLEEEQANIRAALYWSTQDTVTGSTKLRLVGAMGRFWWVRGYFTEGRAYLRDALDQPQESLPARAKALLWAGWLSYWQDIDHREGRALLEESLALSRRIKDEQGIARAQAFLADLLVIIRDAEQAHAVALDSLQRFRRQADKAGMARAYSILAGVALQRERFDESRAFYLKSLRLRRQAGDAWGTAVSLLRLGWLNAQCGDFARAQPFLEEALNVATQLGAKHMIAETYLHLGTQARRHRGDYCRAVALTTRSLTLFREIGDTLYIAVSVYDVAEALVGLHQPEQATRLLGAVDTILNSLSYPAPAAFQKVFAETVAAAQLQLNERTFAVSWIEGQVMTLEDAVSYVLNELEC